MSPNPDLAPWTLPMQPAKAEACLREALKSARALLGPAHLVVGNICHRLAAMLHAGAHR